MATLACKQAELPEYPGYFFTESGEVYSYRHTSGTPRYNQPARKLSGRIREDGYMRYCIRRADGKFVYKKGHQLILLAFRGAAAPGQLCRHLDGNPLNNRLDNLAWGTPLENAADTLLHGTQSRGDTHGKSVLTESDVRSIRKLREIGLSYQKIANRYGVDHKTIHNAVNRVTWKHI